MAERCPWAERVIGSPDSADEEIVRHLESCTLCRAERTAHAELVAAFRGMARPALSPHFRPRLMGQIEEERRRKRIARSRLVVLRFYWFFAAIVCSAVIANLTWKSSAALQWAPVLFALFLFALPIGILLWAIRTNPIELVFETLMSATENRLPGPK